MMKRIALISMILLCLAAFGLSARETVGSATNDTVVTQKDKPKLTREQKKRAKAVADSLEHAMALTALRDSNFVVEADRLVFKHGESILVTSMTNFVSLTGDVAVLQVAPFTGGGINGVGGITLEGRISNVKTSVDKKGNVRYAMMVMGTGISANIDIMLYHDSNKVMVTVNPNFNARRLTIYGRLYPESQSRIHKGTAL